MSPGLRAVLGLLGAGTVVLVFDAAIRTFLLPRVANVRLSRAVARVVSFAFQRIAAREHDYAGRDRRLAMYPPVVLLSYQATWLSLLFVGYAFLSAAAGVGTFARAFELSGSSVFTLGTAAADGPGELAVSFVGAASGLTLLALLIAFLPTIYGAFQRRELSVSRLSVRAGVPATPWGILELAQSVGDYSGLDELWQEWETWFIDLRETHTTITILSFYRSPAAGQTWIGAAAAVLDSAAIYNAAVDRPASPRAGLCIRSGWLALRGLADYFRIPYPPHPSSSDPVSVRREDFEAALDHMERSGVPVLADRDAAWLDFRGWRVNYDAIIETLATRFTSPRLDWSLASSSAPTEPSNRRGLHARGEGAEA